MHIFKIHRYIRTLTLIFIYRSNFQHHREHVYSNFLKFHRHRTNIVCAYTGHTHTRARARTHTRTHTHTHAHTHTDTHTHTEIDYTDSKHRQPTQTLIFINGLNFQHHRENVSNNLWKFHRDRMNGVCPCREALKHSFKYVRIKCIKKEPNH